MPLVISDIKPDKTEFIINEFKLSLIGYPVWEASIVAAKSDYWVKVIPKVDVNKKIIYRPTPRKLSTSSDRYILIVSDLKTIYQPHYNELIDDFFNSIPQDISDLVSKFNDSHWECVKAIILIGEDLISLMKTNPALAYVVVNMDKINKSYICYTNLEILQRMIRTKHKDILKLAGFPEAERMVRIFAKLDTHSVSVEEIIKLRNVLSIKDEITEDAVKLLSFAESINKKLIAFITENSTLLSRLTHKLIFDVINSNLYTEHIKLLSEIRNYSRRLNTLIPILTSLSSISRLHIRLKEEWTEKRKEKVFFPEPPIEDNCFVQAICSENELRDWGRKQHNCIARYAKAVHDGLIYFYKVIFNNEEATLELIVNFGNGQKSSLLGPCNSNVTAGLKIVVDEWLKENRKLQKASR